MGYFQGSGNTDFHLQIAMASRNSRLHDYLAGPIYSILRLYRRRLSEVSGRATVALSEHQAILAAIEAKEPDLAEKRMRAHIAASRENVHNFMQDHH